jgi:hypothetical protein
LVDGRSCIPVCFRILHSHLEFPWPDYVSQVVNSVLEEMKLGQLQG